MRPSARCSRTTSKRGSELAATLLAYFDCNQNAKTTAQRLGIHVNTVRQRLATIEDLLGHWGQASRALEIHIAAAPVEPRRAACLSAPRAGLRPARPRGGQAKWQSHICLKGRAVSPRIDTMMACLRRWLK